ncbi:acyl-CoA dehydrogenase family protein [Kocuria rhizophila]|nr:acyl-CoA dehydrogenase family protein [Kocuria rhizophila]
MAIASGACWPRPRSSFSSRNVFGERVLDFQNTQFELAELARAAGGLAGIRGALRGAVDRGQLDLVRGSSKVKLQPRTVKDLVDRCLQLHGGFGYILESSVAQACTAVRLPPSSAARTILARPRSATTSRPRTEHATPLEPPAAAGPC